MRFCEKHKHTYAETCGACDTLKAVVPEVSNVTQAEYNQILDALIFGQMDVPAKDRYKRLWEAIKIIKGQLK